MYFSGPSMDNRRTIQSYDASRTMEEPIVTLKNKTLWTKFHELDTEMIITKNGRRMFPSLQVNVSNLDPLAIYCVLLELNPINHCRYKYSSSGGWSPAGTEDAQSLQRVYLHPDSPASGEFWMSQHISFGKLKLTNTAAPPLGHVVLSSMHKYQPRIIIAKTADFRTINWSPSTSTIFPETQFIAVTAYQNDKITKLKIDNNPFAKGFRENGQSNKRKKPEADENKNIEHGRECKQTKIDEQLSPLRIEEDRLSSSSLSPLSTERLTPKKNFNCLDFTDSSKYVTNSPPAVAAYSFLHSYHQSPYIPFYHSYPYDATLVSPYLPYYSYYNVSSPDVLCKSPRQDTKPAFTDFSIKTLIGASL